MKDSEKLARIFKVLSVEKRVRMIGLLKHRSLCVNALARALEITPAAVSQHLRVLKDLGLVRGQRRGYRIHYYLNQERLAGYRDLISAQLGEAFLPSTTEPAGETS